MKKKLIAAALATTLVLSSSTFVYADEKDDKIAELQSQIDDMQKTIDDLNAELDKYRSQNSQDNSIADIENYLLDKKLLSGERTEMASEMVGAISGFKYENAEIYEYDTSSEEYKELSAGNSIPLEGMEDITVEALAINGKYVLMGEASDDLIKAFKDFK